MKTKDSKSINLTKTVAAPAEPVINKGWKPVENGDHITHTMPFGGQVPPMVNANSPKEDE